MLHRPVVRPTLLQYWRHLHARQDRVTYLINRVVSGGQRHRTTLDSRLA